MLLKTRFTENVVFSFYFSLIYINFIHDTHVFEVETLLVEFVSSTRYYTLTHHEQASLVTLSSEVHQLL